MESQNTPEPSDLQAAHKREHGEPIDRLVPVSMVVMLFIAVLFFWAGVYITLYNGNFDPMVFDETKVNGGPAEPPPPPEPLPILGAKIFKRNCVQCHQENGLGVEATYPPLVDSEWIKGPHERFGKLLLAGMSGPVVVKGKPYNGNMPSWYALKDRQIAAVMTYLRTKSEWGHNASEVTEEQIAALRKEVGKRDPWNPDELLKMYQ